MARSFSKGGLRGFQLLVPDRQRDCVVDEMTSSRSLMVRRKKLSMSCCPCCKKVKGWASRRKDTSSPTTGVHDNNVR